MKLYHKILILIVIQLLAVFIFCIYQIQMMYLSQKKLFEDRVEIESFVVQKRLDNFVDNLYRTADILLNSQEVTTGLLSSDADLLYNWSKLFIPKYSDKIILADEKGTVIARGDAEFNFGDTIGHHRYFQKALRENPFLGIDVVDGKEFLLLAKAVKPKEDKAIGVIVVGIEMKDTFLQSMIEGTHLAIAYSSSLTPDMKTQNLFFKEYPLELVLHQGELKNISLKMGLHSQEELGAITDMRASLLIGFMVVFVLFFLFVRAVLLQHLESYNALVKLLFAFYDDKLSIDNFIVKTKEIALCSKGTQEIRKIGQVLSRITQKMADTQKSLESLSETDHLTQIANRHRLDNIVDQKLKEAARGIIFSVILLDIDKFKTINDTLGHTVGDKVLKELARTLTNSVRTSDIVGRWGGEEFLIILPATDNEGALISAGALQKKIEQTMLIRDITITASLGVATYKEGDGGRALLKRVDDALYRAKNLGRNRVENENI